MKEIDVKEFKEVIKSGNTVIDFFGEACNSCKMAEPMLNQLATETRDVQFYKFNIKHDEAIIREYSVTSLPTIVFFKNGTELDRLVGLKPKTLYTRKISELY